MSRFEHVVNIHHAIVGRQESCSSEATTVSSVSSWDASSQLHPSHVASGKSLAGEADGGMPHEASKHACICSWFCMLPSGCMLCCHLHDISSGLLHVH